MPTDPDADNSRDVPTPLAAPTAETLFARFRRSLSSTSRKYFTKAPSPKVSPYPTPEEPLENPKANPGEGLSRAGTSDSGNGGKLTPFERFVKLVRKKTRDGPVEFPPPHWQEEEESAVSAEGVVSTQPGVSDASAETGVTQASLPSANPSSDDPSNPLSEHNNSELTRGADEQEGEPETPPEPTSLAWKIQSLLTSLSSTLASTPPPIVSSDAQNGQPNPTAFLTDLKLISILSSPSIMNGSVSKGRQSVWSVLDRLRTSSGASAQVAHPGDDPSASPGAATAADSTPEGRFAADDDESSVMLYAPLVPTADSEVELARSEIVSLVDTVREDPIALPKVDHTADNSASRQRSWLVIWPFTGGSTQAQTENETVRVVVDQQPPVPKVIERRVWVPSTTKISLQVMWWGYRVYVPSVPNAEELFV